jgi:hypothetical protein
MQLPSKKFASSEGKPTRQSNYDDFIRLFVNIRQVERPWEKREISGWQFRWILAKSSPNLVSQGEGIW